MPVDDVPSSDEGVGSGSGSGGVTLSKGAIAGAVIGSIVGLGLIIGLGLLLYREREQKKRLERQRDSGRGVKWMDDPDAATSTTRDGASSHSRTASGGNDSFQLGRMSGGVAGSPSSAPVPGN